MLKCKLFDNTKAPALNAVCDTFWDPLHELMCKYKFYIALNIKSKFHCLSVAMQTELERYETKSFILYKSRTISTVWFLLKKWIHNLTINVIHNHFVYFYGNCWYKVHSNLRCPPLPPFLQNMLATHLNSKEI